MKAGFWRKGIWATFSPAYLAILRVAQVSKLPYRRFPIGKGERVLNLPSPLARGSLEALRYSRLETRVTSGLRISRVLAAVAFCTCCFVLGSPKDSLAQPIITQQ